MIKVFRSFCIACVAAYAIFTTAAAQEESVEMTVLAGQIRSQGYPCSNPISAQRMAAKSAQEEPVYLLTCEDATYQIRLFPDQAAKVTRIK